MSEDSLGSPLGGEACGASGRQQQQQDDQGGDDECVPVPMPRSTGSEDDDDDEEGGGGEEGSGEDAPRPPITYLHIYEDRSLSLGVFRLPARARIPLHNHPGMTVLSR